MGLATRVNASGLPWQRRKAPCRAVVVQAMINSVSATAASTMLLRMAISPWALRRRSSKWTSRCHPADWKASSTPFCDNSTLGVSRYSIRSMRNFREGGLISTPALAAATAVAFSFAASATSSAGKATPSFRASASFRSSLRWETFSIGMPAGDLDHFARVGFRSIVDGADALDSRHGRADQIHHLLHRRKRADARQVGQMVREALPCARGEGIGTIGEHHRLALDQTARSADDRRGHGHDQVHIRAVKILEHRRYVWNLRLGVGTPHLEIFAFLESHRAHPVENSIQANLPARLGREIGKANFEMPAWRDTKCSRCGSDT